MKSLPKQFYKYFWDTNPELINIEKQSRYVIARLMERGNSASIGWIKATYNSGDLLDTLILAKGLERKTALYWSKMLNVRQEEVVCLQKPYRQIRYGV